MSYYNYTDRVREFTSGMSQETEQTPGISYQILRSNLAPGSRCLADLSSSVFCFRSSGRLSLPFACQSIVQMRNHHYSLQRNRFFVMHSQKKFSCFKHGSPHIRYTNILEQHIKRRLRTRTCNLVSDLLGYLTPGTVTSVPSSCVLTFCSCWAFVYIFFAFVNICKHKPLW